MPPLRAVLLTVPLILATPALTQTAPNDPAHACQPGARLTYPIRPEIERMGLEQWSASMTVMSPLPETANSAEAALWHDLAARQEQQAQLQLSALAAMSGTRRDVVLLSAVDATLKATRPTITLFTMTDPRFTEAYLDAMDRHGLVAQADLLREALAAFGPETPLAARYARWSDGYGEILDIDLDDRLLRIEDHLAPLHPQLLDTAERITRADPALLAKVTASAASADEFTRLSWLTGQILGCAGDWYASVDRRDPFASLPQPQHDLAVLQIFMDEVMNGGTHQFFANSSGGLAPEVHTFMAQAGLPEHAAELKAAMDLLGSPYPRDRTARSLAMDSFDEAAHEALNAPTGIMDDGAVYAAMLTTARDAGLME